MVKTRAAVLLPVWVIMVAAVLLLALALRGQPTQLTLGLQGNHSSAPIHQSGPAIEPVVGNQADSGSGSSSAIHKTGTTQVPTGSTSGPVQASNQANQMPPVGPCARAMCPVTEP